MRRVFRRAGLPDPEAEALEAMGSLAAALLERNAHLLRAYRPEVPLRIYLGMVARSVALKLLRKRRIVLPLEAEPLAPLPPELPGDPERLHAALARLPARDRLMLRLIYWQGMNYEAAAAVLGVQPGTVGSLLTRARETLRQAL